METGKKTFIKMPNGCNLVPGGRIRMSLKQVFEIPEGIIEKYGLELDDNAASPGSEVVMWPRENRKKAKI